MSNNINKTQLNIFAFILFLFSLTLCLKINGYLDYSNKYNIKEIYCMQKFNNEYFILDNDTKTTWGLSELHFFNENFIIEFKKEKNLSKFEIYNHYDDKIHSPEILFFASNNKKDWEICDFHSIKTKKNAYYNFKNTCKGTYLKLKYNEQNPGFWPITEIKIHEN